MKVFLCETIHPEAYRLLAERVEILPSWEMCGEADALINRALMIGPAEMDRMPHLKVIAVHGTGLDGVDLAEAKRRGIQVVFAPHLNANAVAELNVTLLLTAARKVVLADRIIRREDERNVTEKMAEAQLLLRGTELRGKTAGLVGFGAIGRKTAEILRNGFGMNCIAWTPRLTRERIESCGVQCASSPEKLIKASDAVILAMPLTAENRGFMNRERLSLMKPGSILVNASRGGLVDEDALLLSLKEGPLGAAACDVMKTDFPDKENPLLMLPNFTATPHIGANTDDALYAVSMACVKQIFDVMEGREPEYPAAQ